MTENSNKNTENLLKEISEISEIFNKAMKEVEDESEAYWESLTDEQQLQVFCAVCRRIYQAEIVDQGTYRHALYQVFGFGPEAYAPAQLAGYLSIHNAIVAPDHDQRLLEEFCKKVGIEDHDAKIKQFWSPMSIVESKK